MKLKSNQLSSHLLKSLASCYLVTGDEHLLVAEALDAIRMAARERGFTSRDLHVASPGFDWNALTASGGNLSLFAERRIVELRLPTGKPGREGAQSIIELAAQTGPDLMLIVTGPKLDKSAAASKWAKTLEQTGVAVPIWPVEKRELPRWVEQRMRRAGLRASRDASRLIADRVEGNLLAAQQEIDKLLLLLGEGEVTTQDVQAAVADSSRYDVYKLADAALAGDAPRAVRIVSGLQAEGVAPILVAWSLARELRTLVTLSDAVHQGENLGAAMQKARVWRNRQELVRCCVSRHRRGELSRLLKACAQIDAAAKGQQRGDPWQLATDVVVSLSL